MDQSDLLQKLQDLVIPSKAGHELDRRHLSSELRALADICESQIEVATAPQIPTRRKKQKKVFDYSKYRTRFVAFHVLYIGWDYQGFASQDVGKTVESALFKALKTTRLIPDRFENSREIKYSKCGRTDKGVSAMGQVVSLVVRSKRLKQEPEASVEEEFDYPTMLNAVLPSDVRVCGWAPILEDFSARYSTLTREYKYFILSEESDPLDIELMQTCCQKFLGLHNFQNFCKAIHSRLIFCKCPLQMNLDQTYTHDREICSIGIDKDDISFPGFSIFVLTIRGKAFLWHQVRCIMKVLLLIGQGLESPDLIDSLLDIEKTPSKPLYKPAADLPLILWETSYPEGNLTFRRSHCSLSKSRQLIKENVKEHLTKLLMLHHMNEKLLSTDFDGPVSHSRQSTHIPLLQRKVEPSFDERMKKHLARRNQRTPQDSL